MFTSPQGFSGKTVALDPAPSHHLRHVLRVRAGETIGVLDGRGGAWLAEVADIGRHCVKADLVCPVTDPMPAVRQVHTALPLIKGDRMDYALQKCTELGVAAIHVVPFQRSVAAPGRSGAREERFRAILTSAAEQSGAFTVPALSFWPDTAAFLSADLPPVKVLAWEEEQRQAACELLAGSEPCVLASGPEGGIPPQEAALWVSAGFRTVSLGARILRAETAAVALAALAILQR